MRSIKLLVTSTAIAALSVTASQAADVIWDEPAAPVAAPVSIIAPYDWTGFYVGGHIGYGWGNTEDISNVNALERDLDGLIGGIQAGYNYQTGNVVFGIEADLTFSDMHDEWGARVELDPYYGKDEQKLFGTVRGRVGYAFDRVLPYVHGGLAWSYNEHGFGCDPDRAPGTLGCTTPFYASETDAVFGYTVGAGIEVAVFDTWSIRGEYSYTDYGDNDVTIEDPNFPGFPPRNFETTQQNVKFGINYRF